MTAVSRTAGILERFRPQPRDLAGRVVAITGGARGLGLATAQALARRGCRVAIGDLDGDLASAEASALPGGGPHLGLPLDVTDADRFSAFLDDVERELGPLDVLVHNAGIMLGGPFVEEDPRITRREIEINLMAVITGTRLALDRMLARGQGQVVNISSAAGRVGLAGEATYCATKHAVYGLDDSLRFELRGTGVDITTVMPGLANTELAAGMNPGRGVKLVEPEEVAEAIVDAVERPRGEVFVPPRLKGLLRFQSVMPPRVRVALGKAFKTDKIATEVDTGARRGYADRASRPVAGADAPDAAGVERG